MAITIEARLAALLFLAFGSAAGPAAAQSASGAPAAPEPAPSPWSEQIAPGFEYRGDFTPEDAVMLGTRQVAAKCAVLPSAEKEGFEVSIRQTRDNSISNLLTLSLTLEIGTGSCSDFKAIRASAYDPAAPLALGDNGRVRFYSGGGDYLVRVLTLARAPEKDSFLLRVRPLDPKVRARTFPPGATGLAAAGPRARPGAANAVEEARTAYLLMCGKGVEKLSPATCQGMRRDLDAAAQAQAAAAREAEVMGVHRQLCTPGRLKVSAETCAAMLAEAKRTLAAEAAAPPVAAPASGAAKAAPRTPAKAGAKAELKSAYDELCAPGAQQVSAETCAALKADAAPAAGRRAR